MQKRSNARKNLAANKGDEHRELEKILTHLCPGKGFAHA